MKKHIIVTLINLILLISVVSGCVNNYIRGTGLIQFNDFEGGFYGIVGDDGEYYNPINLPLDYQEDGIQVKYTLRILDDQASIHQWGIIVEIIKIEKL